MKLQARVTFVLVHGLFTGAWCWELVVPRLRAAGHEVLAFDLPAHGSDHTPVSAVTMASYVARIVAVCERASEPVVLVSHSSSGIWTAQAAEELSGRLLRSIYVAAIVPQNGETIADWIPRAPDSAATPHFCVDEAAGTISIAPELARNAFCNAAPEEVANRVVARLQASPVAPLGTPVTLTASRYGRVPRSYVLCEGDRAIPASTQRAVLDASPCDRVDTIEADHFAFYSAAAELGTALMSQV